MDRFDYYAASRFLAKYAKNRPKKYRNSGWRNYDGYYRGSRYGTMLPGTVYYDTQAQGALKKCWKGFIIANSRGDNKNMRYYAEGIRKFQNQLGLPVKSFPDLGLYEIEYNDSNDANDDTDDARDTTPNELEMSNNRNQDDIEQDSYGYESMAQRKWRERMEKNY
ncbi:MAG: hypothetical protein WAZ77_16395 [Candidatus Nitrosopolaris sp.]